MPNTPSAKADLKRSASRRELNRARKSAMRTWIKKTQKAVEAGNAEEAQASLQQAYKHIDKNAKWNQLHANTAARRKASLAKLVQGMQAN